MASPAIEVEQEVRTVRRCLGRPFWCDLEIETSDLDHCPMAAKDEVCLRGCDAVDENRLTFEGRNLEG
jgi:hypothetical protein